MRAWIVIAMIAALGIFTPARADDSDDAVRLDLARQIEATRSDESYMQIFRATLPYYMSSLDNVMHLSAAERQAMPQRLEQEYRADLPRVREHRATLLAQIFTTDQLRTLLAFDTSETGRAFIAHQEEMSQDSINMQHALNAAVLSDVAQLLQNQRAAQPN